MAQITINEISQNYQYNVGTNSYATVALPITSSWGPGYFAPETFGRSKEQMLEELTWTRFPSNRQGLDAFVSTYRGPASTYRQTKDYSYQMAMTLLTSGYDVLVCRLSPGICARGEVTHNDVTVSVTAKYPGSFGNKLLVKLTSSRDNSYYQLVVYVVDDSKVKTAVENIKFVINSDYENDSIPHISEVESNFVSLVLGDTVDSLADAPTAPVEINLSESMLSGGSDQMDQSTGTIAGILESCKSMASNRYKTDATDATVYDYVKAYDDLIKSVSSKSIQLDEVFVKGRWQLEWLYTSVLEVYDLLKDKLTYSPQRIISPGWDDQNIKEITGEDIDRLSVVSPLHKKLLDVAYHSRCATAHIDIPKCLPRSAVYNESSKSEEQGYAQLLANYVPKDTTYSTNGSLYPTHAALFAPWGQYTYAGTSKMATASPSFLSLLIQRSMILNQSIQYEWALPTNRSHKVKIGKMDYTIPKHLLDQWQRIEGVGVNIITNIPELGPTLWGNSTLMEVPPATYNALQNLSTRYLMNAIEDVVYRCGIKITFNYNNNQAYSAFSAGVSPILDSMKNVGAILDYKIRMSADIDGLDYVNANTLVGKIYITVAGVVNDINIDLIALPPSVDLESYN